MSAVPRKKDSKSNQERISYQGTSLGTDPSYTDLHNRVLYLENLMKNEEWNDHSNEELIDLFLDEHVMYENSDNEELGVSYRILKTEVLRRMENGFR
jgi:hypothetical protein